MYQKNVGYGSGALLFVCEYKKKMDYGLGASLFVCLYQKIVVLGFSPLTFPLCTKKSGLGFRRLTFRLWIPLLLSGLSLAWQAAGNLNVTWQPWRGEPCRERERERVRAVWQLLAGCGGDGGSCVGGGGRGELHTKARVWIRIEFLDSSPAMWRVYNACGWVFTSVRSLVVDFYETSALWTANTPLAS